MHQHPRTPAVPSQVPNLPAKPTPTSLREDLRDWDSAPTSPSTDTRPSTARGLGIDGADSSDKPRDSGPSKDAMAKLSQIIANYHTKAALIILQSRVELPPAYQKGSDVPRINRWFNVELDDSDTLREPLRTWKNCDASENRPPPLVIETFLDTKGLTNNQTLVILDDQGKRWDVQESLAASRGAGAQTPYQSGSDEIILERWRIELGEPSSSPPADLGSILPTVYKKSIVLFRSLFTYSKFLPAWKLCKRSSQVRMNSALKIRYRVADGSSCKDPTIDHLTAPLYEGTEKVVDVYKFGVTESPAGPFSVQVSYRTNCDFRVDDSEALLSSRFMGADDDIFRPSLPADETMRANIEVGSVPVGRRTIDNPDHSRAYGSLSTFHQVGPATGASPISALRAARDSGAVSPSPSDSPTRITPVKAAPIGRAAQLASEGGNSNFQRRPSVSFQPFKAPTLSASPSLADNPLGVSPRTSSFRVPIGTSADSRVMPPPSVAAAARRPPLASDNVLSFSNSTSPRSAPISRYTSSFSHRRGRLSVGNSNKMDDEISSGRLSVASPSAQPGSALLSDTTGTSADSIAQDSEDISNFLKLLDAAKGALDVKPGAVSSFRQPGTDCLARYQAMRESNDALSESMAASMNPNRFSVVPRTLSGVPPIAGTSVSTVSSAGKPMSPHTPHTPHTPAIRSRLSSNSVADDIVAEHDRRGVQSPTGETARHPAAQRIALTAGAIDIPTSPRVFDPTFRGTSYTHHRAATTDSDEVFPFGLRSISLGTDELGNASRQTTPHERPPFSRQQSTTGNSNPPTAVPVQPEGAVPQDQSVPVATSSSSTANVYQPRFASSRGRGFSGGPHSLSSASSSLARGATIPPHLSERETDRDGNASGSNSGNSTLEIRRGSQRPSSNRAPPSSQFEDDEPLLFAMSDFGVSRRSLDENRHGNHGGTDSNSASRRGSGRRGNGLPSFHHWT
ncbi:Autophagy-related protein 13 [Penicillium taxi]|uniref:Autophagy-related protein 13 n=1 Tax=Penicillium taxi TaxID=168475 RepID=UPI002545491E|nr:Autophagy-related protein 13 [Penicillium taxi]KAJ5899564.1 Autophagy-related protein 13 [Penicillium taxi]